MLAEKPALDLHLKADYHGLLTHMFQEFVLAEEWGSRAKARRLPPCDRKSEGSTGRAGSRCSPGYGMRYSSRPR